MANRSETNMESAGSEHIVSKRFPDHLLKKSGLRKYTAEKGVTVMTIVYDADSGEGWLDAIAIKSTQKDQLDNL